MRLSALIARCGNLGWKRVQEHAGPAPKDMKKWPGTQWVKPGIKACVKHLRGEEDLGTRRWRISGKIIDSLTRRGCYADQMD